MTNHDITMLKTPHRLLEGLKKTNRVSRRKEVPTVPAFLNLSSKLKKYGIPF